MLIGQTLTMNNTVVFDLDGTLANVEHRRHFVTGKQKNFDAFYEAAVYDAPNLWCVEMVNTFQRSGFQTVIVSARPTSLEIITALWLKSNGVDGKAQLYLLRDEANKSTPDVDLKRRWLNIYGKHRILFAVDDRQRVVDMWRSEGIVCLQCDKWEES